MNQHTNQFILHVMLSGEVELETWLNVQSLPDVAESMVNDYMDDFDINKEMDGPQEVEGTCPGSIDEEELEVKSNPMPSPGASAIHFNELEELAYLKDLSSSVGHAHRANENLWLHIGRNKVNDVSKPLWKYI